jgi:hypothetical protein
MLRFVLAKHTPDGYWFVALVHTGFQQCLSSDTHGASVLVSIVINFDDSIETAYVKNRHGFLTDTVVTSL